MDKQSLAFHSFHPVLKILKQSSKFTNKKIKTSFRKHNSFSIDLISPDCSCTYKPGEKKKKKVDSMTLSRWLFEKRAMQMESHAKLILRDWSIASTSPPTFAHYSCREWGAPCVSLSQFHSSPHRPVLPWHRRLVSFCYWLWPRILQLISLS